MKTKRLTAAILTVCLSLSLALPCAASATGVGGATLDEAVQTVNALGIWAWSAALHGQNLSPWRSKLPPAAAG